MSEELTKAEELAEAYAKQVRLEMQLRSKDTIIRRLKEIIEHKDSTVNDMRTQIGGLDLEVGNLFQQLQDLNGQQS